jgi:hypothetical protein
MSFLLAILLMIALIMLGCGSDNKGTDPKAPRRGEVTQNQ